MNPACPNCGALVRGRYCPDCGQRQDITHTSLARVVRDLLEDQFSLNGTLPRTLAALFFRPGRLTREYMAQRIARYVPPLRLYLATSVLFFLLLSIMSTRSLTISPQEMARVDSLRQAMAQEAAQTPQKSAALDSASTPVGRRFGVFTSELEAGAWFDNLSINLGNERLNQLVLARLSELKGLPFDLALRDLGRSFIQEIPKVMFLLLPVYALLLKLLYFRRNRFYVEHFIFALHLHAFVFLTLLLLIPLRNIPGLTALLLIWIPVYALLALKRVYGQGWVKTTLKWAVLGNTYIVLLSFGVLLGVFLAVLEL